MIEVTVRLYAADTKPKVDDVISFVTHKGEWCMGTYEGHGNWYDWTHRNTHKTNAVRYWHHVIKLESIA